LQEVYLAIVETDLPDEQFPEVCPFSLEEVLSEDFWPDSPSASD
jgi:hypothetical protein